ncbi:MAG: hypothetical protein JW726_16765 [Anaerolineales bacterium]|nr:hypothetical protein [Anaerolineales bacterium]
MMNTSTPSDLGHPNPSSSSISAVEAGSAPLRVKLAFWLLLGVLSVILAEVVSYASQFPFFDFWGLAVVCPLYTLHTLVLLYVVARWRRPTLATLFLAGALFGMYEAYMTKVFWDPTWGDFTWQAGGIYLGQTAVLILFWHPWMAFIMPVVLGERFFADSGEMVAAMPPLLQKIVSHPKGGRLAVAAFALFCGLTQATNSPDIAMSLLTSLGAGLVFWLILGLGRRLKGGRSYHMNDLLPSARQIIVLVGLLLLGYLVLGLLMRPEALPRTFVPHLTVWGLYLVLGGLLYRNLKKASSPLVPAERMPSPFPWQEALIFWLVFPVTSALFVLLRPLAFAGVVLSWVFGIGLGLALLVWSAWRK